MRSWFASSAAPSRRRSCATARSSKGITVAIAGRIRPERLKSYGDYSRSSPLDPDYDLMINRSPNGVRLSFEFQVDYFVTYDGKSRDCALSPDKPAPAELVSLACQAVASSPAHIIRDHNHHPVEARDHATFRFSLAKAQRK
jgi:hypothetical protein